MRRKTAKAYGIRKIDAETSQLSVQASRRLLLSVVPACSIMTDRLGIYTRNEHDWIDAWINETLIVCF
jgi:hypothetical protein